MISLEAIYLMHVALHFETYSDIFKFLQVSKTCKEAIERLKINPWFASSESVIKFCTNFNPETMNCLSYCFFSKQLFNKVSNIRNPMFNSILKSNINDITSILPKVYHISLYYTDESETHPESRMPEETSQFFIENAQQFNNLRCVRGDIELVIAFFKKFTDNGSQMFVHFPTRVELFNLVKRSSSTEQNLISQIKKYLPHNGMTQIEYTTNTHVKSKEELKCFDGIEYHYTAFSDNQCEFMSEAIECDEGKIDIKGTLNCNRFNSIIEKCYADIIKLHFEKPFEQEEGDVFKRKKYDNWNIPKCVLTLELTLNFEYQSDDYYLMPINMDYLQILTLNECGNISFEGDYPLLREVNILGSHDIQFIGKDKTININEIAIEGCSYCSIELKFSPIESVILQDVEEVTMNIKMDSLKEFVIMASRNCYFNPISFKDIFVQIEECSEISFYNIDKINQLPEDQDIDEEDLISPLQYCGVNYTKFQEIIQSCIFLPSLQLFTKMSSNNYNKLFQVRWFYVSCSRVQSRGPEIRLKKQVSSWLINTLFSSNFYKKEDDRKNMYLVFPNGTGKVVDSSIRYFEVTVQHQSLMSIGIIHSTKFEYDETEYIGNIKYSIGYMNDSGNVYEGDHKIACSFKPYGLYDGNKNVIGCGFNSITHEVFFTCDGIKGYTKKIDWEGIDAAISLSLFKELHINYGQEPFVYNIYNEYQNDSCLVV
ncbi:hypothetical protein conserved domain containing [Entamoeba histolytica]|nr:hypothetical protein conserved domain containing [Entamoeba histolytica]